MKKFIIFLLFACVGFFTVQPVPAQTLLTKNTNLERLLDQLKSWFFTHPDNPSFMKKIRPPSVAGQFYPKDPNDLTKIVHKYLDNTVPLKLAPPKAILTPHAGYAYSGATAAHGFGQLTGWDYDRVILIGPSHREYFAGASIPDVTHYQTPIGDIEVSEVTQVLLKNDHFFSHETAHNEEHALEVELPFLQEVLGDFELIPVLIGSANSFEQVQQIAESLKPYLDDKTLLVVSTDFTHYGPNYGYVPFTDNHEANIKTIDQKAFDLIRNKAAEGFFNYVRDSKVTIDGGSVVPVLLHLFPDAESKLLDYQTSGELTADYTNSVSYASFAFYEKTDLDLTDSQKKYLTKLAQESLHKSVKNEPITPINSSKVDDRLKSKQGVFVTLEESDQLRGCIGYIAPQKSIYQAVIDNARSAALHDSRFSPVSTSELSDIDLEISILSVPTLLTGKNVEEKYEKLRPGIDGLVLQLNGLQSTYLPQVWGQLPDKDLFLSSLCEKAGFKPDAWKNNDMLWYTYQAVHFSEGGN